MITLRIKLYKEKPDGSVDYAEPHLHPRNQFVLQDSNELEDLLNLSFYKIKEVLERWTHNGSGWIVDRVVSMNINISRYQPLRGCSYLVLPKYISNKKACINVKNKDDDCLRWVLRFAIFPADNHTDRMLSYPSEDGFNFDGIDAPTPIYKIKLKN